MGLREEKVDFWKAKGKNALFTGPTGVGKTAMVLAMMQRSELSLDTNVSQWSPALNDFVGVSPENADLLFFDDFGDLKSQQAANEVLSLRRWKGKAIRQNAVVWACHTMLWDEKEKEYAGIDSVFAQKFEVCVTVPNSLNLSYFEEKFGQRVAAAAHEWWNELPGRYSNVECEVNPRRLEQALVMWQQKGDMRDVLPMTANVSKLMMTLNVGPVKEKLDQLLKDDDTAKKLFLANENNFATAVKYIFASDTLMRAFVPLFPPEKLCRVMEDPTWGDKAYAFIFVNSQTNEVFRDTLKDILKANMNKRLVKKIRRSLTESPVIAETWTVAVPLDREAMLLKLSQDDSAGVVIKQALVEQASGSGPALALVKGILEANTDPVLVKRIRRLLTQANTLARTVSETAEQ